MANPIIHHSNFKTKRNTRKSMNCSALKIKRMGDAVLLKDSEHSSVKSEKRMKCLRKFSMGKLRLVRLGKLP